MAEKEIAQPEETNPSEAEPMQENELRGEEDAAMPDSEHSASEETSPEETPPEETSPEETPPEETSPEETPPEETPPEETSPEAMSAFQGQENLEALVGKLIDDTKIAMDEAESETADDLVAEIAKDGAEVEIADVQAPQSAEKVDDGRRWYVVHCYSGYENKVRHNLEQRIETMGMKDRIFDVVVPTEEEIEVKNGKRRTIERRVFPGYILVQMILTEESWYVVRNTPGVAGFVGMGNEPTPLRPEEVSSIIKRMEAEAPRIKVTYKIGQKVRIIDGPFNDFIGTVDDIDMERAKVRVMVSFFGRETPVELDFLQVDKA